MLMLKMACPRMLALSEQQYLKVSCLSRANLKQAYTHLFNDCDQDKNDDRCDAFKMHRKAE